ncbi:hypothetical protein Sjap_022503 [Stephania japonica]|uniref:Rhamnogalacturonan lyase domain-containing protein n=1 Tax=Stephania japonica TaxID=461633 RepID=A0AAP0HUH0_9MAGN
MFVSAHYSGEDLVPKFEEREAWKKVFGPVFMYVNSAMMGEDPLILWEDAKAQVLKQILTYPSHQLGEQNFNASVNQIFEKEKKFDSRKLLQTMIEVQSWPYSFPEYEDYPTSDERGSITGRLLVQDEYVDGDYIAADSAYMGLALPGDVGSWQRESKVSLARRNGYFSINDEVRAGDYNLYGWVPDVDITVTPGCDIDLGDLVYETTRGRPTLWEIGILIVLFRQYGLWERYAELYPNGDLVYRVGVSDYKTDWFLAQVNSQLVNQFKEFAMALLGKCLEAVKDILEFLLDLRLNGDFHVVIDITKSNRDSIAHFNEFGVNVAMVRHKIVLATQAILNVLVSSVNAQPIRINDLIDKAFEFFDNKSIIRKALRNIHGVRFGANVIRRQKIAPNPQFQYRLSSNGLNLSDCIETICYDFHHLASLQPITATMLDFVHRNYVFSKKWQGPWEFPIPQQGLDENVLELNYLCSLENGQFEFSVTVDPTITVYELMDVILTRCRPSMIAVKTYTAVPRVASPLAKPRHTTKFSQSQSVASSVRQRSHQPATATWTSPSSLLSPVARSTQDAFPHEFPDLRTNSCDSSALSAQHVSPCRWSSVSPAHLPAYQHSPRVTTLLIHCLPSQPIMFR